MEVSYIPAGWTFLPNSRFLQHENQLTLKYEVLLWLAPFYELACVKITVNISKKKKKLI